MLLGRFAPRPGFICAKDLLLWAGLNQRSGVPWGQFLSSVLRWKIAPAHRIADGGGRVEGPQFFQHAVELALDLVEAAHDQRETVVGGHDFTASEDEAPAAEDWGACRPGPQLAERIELGLITLRRWEKCAGSLRAPAPPGGPPAPFPFVAPT